jgi:hypothetical protein
LTNYPSWSDSTHRLRKLITAVEGHYPTSRGQKKFPAGGILADTIGEARLT